MQKGKPDEPLRIVIDESSLTFHSANDLQAEEALDEFNDTLSELLRSGIPVSKVSFCLEFECRAGLPLYALLYERSTNIDVDTLRRCSDLLDRCADWDEDVYDVVTSCVVSEKPVESWSIGYAVLRSSGHLMACLVCPTTERRGLLPATTGDASAEIFFLAGTSDTIEYWQLVLSRERIAFEQFFTVAKRAFPKLAFHPDLDFRRFRAPYDEVYNWVVLALTVINNFLTASFESRKGVRQAVQADIASYGVDVSPESSQTHKNTRAINQRTVKYDGVAYLCEWHAKRTWNTDRIHFTTPRAFPGGQILIGIFVDHLDT
ncbi:hypothetical protein [Verrucosispora sp. WMMD1129]|uniref:hypothetical protein n=1 Tax=Verrucosispora sp. WMMD1129 TaxID=3016093 RepID=UPI00249AA92C|nr:hypothetical protein [Verrucosispora sp. WMMD1129]WFE43331.1 hypothetical protein O7624_02870 [Verrucosispora sp. WMMD1129]